MNFLDAFGIVFFSFFGIGAMWWYMWCWKEILFTVNHPREFFSYAYVGHPTLFVLASGVVVLAGLAQTLVWVTN